MTKQIPLSELRGDTTFAAKVTAHCAELNAHADHMARVAHGEADPYPPPFAPALIDQAIRQDATGRSGSYVEDYQIVDDGPTPEQVFAQKKQTMLAQVITAERAAMHAVLPEGKRRLMSRQVGVAAAKKPEDRTPDDKALLADDITRQAKFDAIDHHAAVQMAAIEDLMAGTIDVWQMAPFPAP